VAPEKVPEAFADMTPDEARIRGQMDVMRYKRIAARKDRWGFLGLVLALAGLIWLVYQLVPGLVCCFVGLIFVIRGMVVKMRQVKELVALEERYETDDTDLWLEQAESYAKERKWNVALWLYSAAMHQPTWRTTATYGNIEIEYDRNELYKPFAALVN
jgi:hypothetical protein